MRRWGILIALVVFCLAALPHAANAQRQLAPPSFTTLLEAHAKNNLPRGSIPRVAKGQAIAAPMVYVTVTRTKVMLYGQTLVQVKGGLLTSKQLRRCDRSICLPRVRDRIASARARLAYKLGAVPRVLVFVDGNASYDTLLTVLRSICESGAALSLRLAARDRRGTLVALPVLAWPNRRVVVDHAGRPGLIRVEVSGIGGIVTATKTYSARPQRAHNARDLLDVLGRLKLASGRDAVFLSGGPHSSAAHMLAIIAHARTLFSSVILTSAGDGVYAVP